MAKLTVPIAAENNLNTIITMPIIKNNKNLILIFILLKIINFLPEKVYKPKMKKN